MISLLHVTFSSLNFIRSVMNFDVLEEELFFILDSNLERLHK